MALLWTGAAHAETQIGTGLTQPVTSSTVAGGKPDDINIVSGGSVKPASGVAVTLDTNNYLINSGSIVVQNADNSVGVLVLGAHTGSVTNNSIIEVDETTAAGAIDAGGVASGPFATGTGRYGIRVIGPGDYTGAINSAAGSITVKGNDSYGISVETNLIGTLTNAGSISVIGDRTIGMRTTGNVTGNVVSSGGITAQGLNATALSVGGDVSGQVLIQNVLTATGYKSTTRSTLQSQLDGLQPTDLLLGGPAVSIMGNVGGGVLVNIPATTTDAIQTSGAVDSYGSAPAIQVGAVGRGITLGNVGTGDDAYGIVIRGSVVGSGVYDGFSATGMQIGVAGGGAVNTTGGIRIEGTLTGAAYKADSTALHLLSGAVAPVIWSQSNLTSTMNGDTTNSAYGIVIDKGASVTRFLNTGILTANVAGFAGNAYGVVDKSGTLISIENVGTITASVTPTLATTVATGTGTAIDLSANTTGIAIQQDNGGNSSVTPSITGSILFGSGSDDFKILAGTVAGDIVMGAGANSLTIDNGSVVTGGLSANGGTVSLSIPNGTLSIKSANTINVTQLNLGSTSTLSFSADPANNAHTLLNVAGTANLAAGAKYGLTMQSLLTGQVTYTVIHASTLNVGTLDSSSLGAVPYLYTASLSSDPTAGNVNITVTQKTAADLALPTAIAAAYDPMIQAINKDAQVREAFLDQTTRTGLLRAFNQLLPDHSGAVFQAVAAEGDATARAIDDRQGPDASGAWAQESNVLIQQRGSDDSPGYRATGFNIVGGSEWGAGRLGVVGATLGIGSVEIDSGAASAAQTLSVNSVEAGGYWRYVNGRMVLSARLAGSYVGVRSRRVIYLYDGSDNLLAQRGAAGDWSGWAVNGRVAAAYEGNIGSVYARPSVAVDYLRLEEGAYSERNGGDAIDLHVSARQTSRETTFAGFVTGKRYGSQDGWWGPEMTLGYREIGAGENGSTTAQFQSGTDSFNLLADQIKGGGVVARVALKGEVPGGAFAVEGGAETRDSLQIYDLRVAAHFRF